jgi:hypothetical protein
MFHAPVELTDSDSDDDAPTAVGGILSVSSVHVVDTT